MRVFRFTSIWSLFLILSLFYLSACGMMGPKKVITSPQSTPQVQAPISPLMEIENAFGRGDYQRVEVLGQRLIDSPEASSQEKSRAATLYSVAAIRSSHPNLALTALDAWRNADPQADATREWQEIWCDAMMQLPSRDARIKANELYQDSNRRPLVRGVAAVFFAVRQWEDAELGESLEALEYVYEAAPDTASKGVYEARLSTLLSKSSGTAIGLISNSVTEDNKGKFPYSIILIDQLRRQTMNAQMRAQAEEALASLQGSIQLADPSLFRGPPEPVQFSARSHAPSTQPSYTPSTGPGIGQSSVAMVLPRSGQFGGISEKIIAGAEVAAREANANLIIIDTDQSGWIDQIRSLPQDTVAIGGPLRSNDYAAIKAQGLLANKAFFAFLPSLEAGDEGRVAWRLFTSPQDQIQSLVSFTAGIGVRSHASLYPNENYGQRMNQMFEAEVSKAGGTSKSASYTPNQPDAWLRAAGELMAGGSGGKYQAIFLPDNIRNAEKIIPSIQYYDSSRHLILGSSLWEQGLASSGVHAAENFSVSVFPGSWNPSSPSAAASRLMSALGAGADFWSGLGYDFVRLSPSLNLQAGWDANQLNATLSRIQHDWSIAPIRWSNGQATQSMFLFTPDQDGGYKAVDQNHLQSAIK